MEKKYIILILLTFVGGILIISKSECSAQNSAGRIRSEITHILSSANPCYDPIKIDYIVNADGLPYADCENRLYLRIQGTEVSIRNSIKNPHRIPARESYEIKYTIARSCYLGLLHTFLDCGFLEKEFTEEKRDPEIDVVDNSVISLSMKNIICRKVFYERISRKERNSVLTTREFIPNWPPAGSSLETLTGIPWLLYCFFEKIISSSPIVEAFKAVKADKIKELAELIDKYPLLLKARDRSGNSFLHVASKRGNLKILKLLLDKGVNVDVKDNFFDQTSLHTASYAGCYEAASLLVEKGADVNAKDAKGDTPLFFAAMKGNGKLVSLLAERGAFIDEKDNDCASPLLLASDSGNIGVIEFLLNRGAKVNVKTKKQGWTPLHKAAEAGNTEILELLILKEADVNAKDNDGDTALQNAVYNRHTASVKILINHGADVNSKNNSGQTPLNLAIKQKFSDIADLLRKHGAKE